MSNRKPLSPHKRRRKSSEVAEDMIGQFQDHQSLQVVRNNALQQGSKLDKHDRKVLIIHTGGTIGMFSSENGYRPQKDRFTEFLRSYPYFCDKSETFFVGQQNGFIISPETVYGKRIWYKFQEMKTLIDSSNMNVYQWNTILEQLQKVYDDYDAFIILHGTDTMSYTASILSFAIENLNKTIILTGAQIPISQTRNDSINNLLCSLVIAGHFTIPEVLLVFDNSVFRGNRTKKHTTLSLNTFYCPNYVNIGTFGLTINIHWKRIIPATGLPVKFVRLTGSVGNIKLAPGTITIPKQKYVVVESFGCGNMPTSGPVFDWLKQNSQKSSADRQFILNVSQVENAATADAYEAGSEAVKLGVVPGRDMTFEAAFSKLLYLSSKQLTESEIIKKVKQNLRGELTEKSADIGLLALVRNTFRNKKPQFNEMLYSTVYPSVAIEKNSNSVAIEKLIEFGMDVKKTDYNGCNILHRLCQNQKFTNIEGLDILLEAGADMNLQDNKGNTPSYYVLKCQNMTVLNYLKEKGAKLCLGSDEMTKLIRQDNIQIFQSLSKYGCKFEQLNGLEQSVGMICVILGRWTLYDIINHTIDQGYKDLTGKDINAYLKFYSRKAPQNNC